MSAVRFPLPDNVYGSRRRFEWMRAHLRIEDRIVDFGCGTGCMLTLPLAAEGFDITGYDNDRRSVSYGRSVAAEFGIDPDHLNDSDWQAGAASVDVIIASEVLEHIVSRELPAVLQAFRTALTPQGRLLVTVPNGYGWFEIEQLAWQRLRLADVLATLRLDYLTDVVRRRLIGHTGIDPYPNTLADDVSPHVQRFSWSSVEKLLTSNGFRVIERTGSVLFSGPLMNQLFRGYTPVLALNGWLGRRLPWIAAGFYLVCQVGDGHSGDGDPASGKPAD
jgi:SAM-dependent methyltransferase